MKNRNNNLSVFVCPPGGAEEEDLFRAEGYMTTKASREADIFVWTGGEDVNPRLYGELPIKGVYFNPRRDSQEIGYWRDAVRKPNSLKVGICRGAQLLNVLNGGKLWQDVDHHALQDGPKVLDILTGKEREVSSTHHQQMRPAPNAQILATTHLSKNKYADLIDWHEGGKNNSHLGTDYEVLWYPDTRSLCFQGHPEYSLPEDTKVYFHELIRRYI